MVVRVGAGLHPTSYISHLPRDRGSFFNVQQDSEPNLKCREGVQEFVLLLLASTNLISYTHLDSSSLWLGGDEMKSGSIYKGRQIRKKSHYHLPFHREVNEAEWKW
jgi:hypothetical protein